MPQVGFKCPEEVKEQVDLFCKENGMTKSDFWVRAALSFITVRVDDRPPQKIGPTVNLSKGEIRFM